jgi:hypothetical protein
VQAKRLSRKAIGASVTATLALVLLAINFSDRYVPAVSDWYTRMAIQYLPESALRFAPITDAERAFYVCARSVVKRMGGESSIATFASTESATTRSLGDGRLLIQSHVDESVEAGVNHRHVFRCTVRPEGSRWVIENLELQAVERVPTEVASSSR